MEFKKPLIPGTLIKRYKRFLAEVELDSGGVVTAHCANTGSMMQVSEPGSPIMLSEAENAARKTKYDWQLTQVNGRWAGINTAVPNILLREGFETGVIPQFTGYDSIQMEVKYGANSRADAVLTGPNDKMYVEAKNVTLVEDGRALFPDAVTLRGTKHLDELANVVSQGHRALMFFCVQRMEAKSAGIAAHIDPIYAEKIAHVMNAGVEVIAWRADITPERIVLERELEFAV